MCLSPNLSEFRVVTSVERSVRTPVTVSSDVGRSPRGPGEVGRERMPGITGLRVWTTSRKG